MSFFLKQSILAAQDRTLVISNSNDFPNYADYINIFRKRQA